MNLLQKVYAAGPIPGNIDNPITVFGPRPTLSNVFGFLLNILLGVGWALVFVCAALAIVKYIMSQGDPKETGAATRWALYMAIGALIMVMITVLRGFAFQFTGAENSWQVNDVTNFMRNGGTP